MPPVLIYNGARMHTVSADKNTNVRLVPGKNIVEAADFEKLTHKKTGSESFKDMVESGEVEILGDEVVNPDSKEVDITKMQAKDAKVLVESEPSIDVLNGYLEAETAGDNRPSVVKAINAAIETIEQADQGGSSE